MNPSMGLGGGCPAADTPGRREQAEGWPRLWRSASCLRYSRKRGAGNGFTCRLALLGLLLIPLLAPASEIDVRLAYARADEGQWLVTTRVDFELDAEAERLVRQGLRLKVEVEFSVAQPRPVITPKRLAGFVRALYLEYEAASGRFVVSIPSADARAEFATMFSALRKIGYLTDQPVIAQSALAAGQPYAFSVQARVFPENANWWSRNVAGRLGLGLSLSSATYTWSLTP